VKEALKTVWSASIDIDGRESVRVKHCGLSHMLSNAYNAIKCQHEPRT